MVYPHSRLIWLGVRLILFHTEMSHLLHYDSGDFPAFTLVEDGTRFSDPEGMQG